MEILLYIISVCLNKTVRFVNSTIHPLPFNIGSLCYTLRTLNGRWARRVWKCMEPAKLRQLCYTICVNVHIHQITYQNITLSSGAGWTPSLSFLCRHSTLPLAPRKGPAMFLCTGHLSPLGICFLSLYFGLVVFQDIAKKFLTKNSAHPFLVTIVWRWILLKILQRKLSWI